MKFRKIEFASNSRIEAVREIANDFMFEILDFNAGEYFISDESSLSDFIDHDISDVWGEIIRVYGVDQSQVGSDNMADIFETIKAKRNLQ